jgi:hypothetical protein
VRFAPLFLLLLTGAAEAQPAASPLQLELNATGATVTGLPVGGRAALVAVLRDEEQYQGLTATFAAELTDSDGDGRLSWDLARPLPAKALFLAVDIASGRWAWTTPEGFELPGARALAEVELMPGSSAGLVGWKLPASFAQTLLVRPGVGAWLSEIYEGRPGSVDTAIDGAADFAFAATPALGSEAAFPGTETAASDLVIGLAPHTFRFWVWPAATAEGVAP